MKPRPVILGIILAIILSGGAVVVFYTATCAALRMPTP
jgi:hypothetical protein